MNILDFYPLFLQANAVHIDSRKAKKNDIFFAFSGENFNAAALAEEVIGNGALAVIVEDATFQNVDKNIFYVPSTLDFLQQLAMHHRAQLTIPIIGLTGSNGKTTSKELIHTVLSQKYKVQYTFGNLNNHIGVPLSILSINKEHEMAVIEMGANHQGEIAFLCTIAQPDYGYITNFGKAHLEGFGGIDGVIKGKSELYDYLKNHHKTLIINEQDELQVKIADGYLPYISFGRPTSSYNFEMITKENRVGLHYSTSEIWSQLTGAYNFSNLSVAVTLGLHFGLDIQMIKEGIEQYTPSNMRSQVLIRNNRTYILDTYNANPTSMEASLFNFSRYKGAKVVILGDMLELGNETEKEHQYILELAHSLGFHAVFTVGPHFSRFNSQDFSFDTTADFIAFVQNKPIAADAILLKASRGIALEKVLDFI